MLHLLVDMIPEEGNMCTYSLRSHTCFATDCLSTITSIFCSDLKPENIGFDIRDDIKVFDFGLSKELHMAKEKYSDGTYKLTPMSK